MKQQYTLHNCYCKHDFKCKVFLVGNSYHLLLSIFFIVFSLSLGNAQSTPNLLAYWKFDKGNGQIVKDHSGNNADGTMGSTALADKNDPIWEVGCCGSSNKSAIQFDGKDDYVEVNVSTINLIGTGDFTMEAFIKASYAKSPYPTLLSNRKKSAKKGFILFFIGYSIAFQIGGKNHQIPNPPNLFNGNCNYVAITRTVNKLNFYINGQSVHTKAIDNNLDIGTAHPLWIGQDARSPKGHSFKGSIEEVKIWNIAKTPTEIQQSYITGPACPSVPPNKSSFPSLEKKLAGGFYRVEEATGILKFRYSEEYNDQDKQLTYNIYDRTNTLVTSNSKQPLMVQFGLNEYQLDLSCNGDALQNGFHVLEVINEKKEKWYLRFLLEKNYKADCP